MTPSRRSDVVPKDRNGKVDWLAYIRTSWPIVIFLGTVVFWVSGRLQTVEEKRQQHQTWEKPWRNKIERNEKDIDLLRNRIDSHTRIDGHPVMRSEYRQLLRRIEQLEKEVDGK